MDSAIPIRLKIFAPKLKIYKPPVDKTIRPFDNPWHRMEWFLKHKPKPSKFKRGDTCIVIKKKDQLLGKKVTVLYASGDHIECGIGNKMIVYKQEDLKCSMD